MMDPRLNSNNKAGSEYHLSPQPVSPEPPPETRQVTSTSSTRNETAQQRPGQNAQQLSERLKASAVKVETARAALGQMSDLVDSVIEGMRRNAASSSGGRANERLMESAFATAQDIVEHARSDGQYLLGPGRAAPYRSQAVDGKTLAAIGAYQRNQNAYGQSAEQADPPLVRHALQSTRAFVSGPEGVLETLRQMAEHGPHEGPSAEKALHEAKQTLKGLTNMLGDARVREIDQPLQEMQQPRGTTPFDLKI